MHDRSFRRSQMFRLTPWAQLSLQALSFLNLIPLQNIQNMVADPTISNDRHAGLFLDAFPFEIAVKIFSFTNQRDCLSCMAVCRRWYFTVPLYSRDVWAELRLSESNVHKNNRRWEQCVGKHVKTVEFDHFATEQKLHRAMERLTNYGCTRIQCFRFNHCVTQDQAKFLASFKRLASYSTTRLEFINHSVNHFGLFSILSTCPQLHHFSFTPSEYHKPQISNYIGSGALPHILFKNLASLYIDTEIDIQIHLIPILRRCPNLRHLAYGGRNGGPFPDSSGEFLDKLFSWCPNLAYLETNPGCLMSYRDAWKDHFDPHNDGTGLRTFIARGAVGYGPYQIGPCLIRNAHTLEFLGLGKYFHCNGDWSSTLREFHGTRLRSLILRGIYYNKSAITTMLSQCPVLEELVLIGNDQTRLNITKALKSLPRLKLLSLGDVHLDYVDGDDMISGPVQLFQHLESRGTGITEIRLQSVYDMTDDLLLALTYLSPLKHLTLDFAPDPSHSDSGLCQFADMLRRTAVESLELVIRRLPKDALLSLASLPHLRNLEASCSIDSLWINAEALAKALNRRTASLKRVLLKDLMLAGTDDEAIDFLQREVCGYSITNQSKSEYFCDILLQTING
ncbi:hypothetical protein BJV82DRAFT_710835 [Fennellomyces sp. T-0311]|nr:hypothetical protein BJV82DRAFT_710835 [Fennellomyces sp. T-0311]